MNIEIRGLAVAKAAVGQLFGTTPEHGPQRSFPDSLAELDRLPDGDEVWPVRLHAPGSGAYWMVRLHRVEISHNGVPQGQAWRMSDEDLVSLRRWETVCRALGVQPVVSV